MLFSSEMSATMKKKSEIPGHRSRVFLFTGNQVAAGSVPNGNDGLLIRFDSGFSRHIQEP